MSDVIDRQHVSGWILAGGQGRRMGGQDKGLVPYRGRPLVLHVLERLAPQVGTVAISANRHLDRYAALGVPVWPDGHDGFAGPLAGLLSGLQHGDTPWVLSVPCDAPALPLDLAQRLMRAALTTSAGVVLAATRDDNDQVQVQPVFSLVRRDLRETLAGAFARGERSIRQWAASLDSATVVFDDAPAFRNVNTPAQLDDTP